MQVFWSVFYIWIGSLAWPQETEETDAGLVMTMLKFCRIIHFMFSRRSSVSARTLNGLSSLQVKDCLHWDFRWAPPSGPLQVMSNKAKHCIFIFQLTFTSWRLIWPLSGGSAGQGSWHTQPVSFLAGILARGVVGEVSILMSALHTSFRWNGDLVFVALNSCQQRKRDRVRLDVRSWLEVKPSKQAHLWLLMVSIQSPWLRESLLQAAEESVNYVVNYAEDRAFSLMWEIWPWWYFQVCWHKHTKHLGQENTMLRGQKSSAFFCFHKESTTLTPSCWSYTCNNRLLSSIHSLTFSSIFGLKQLSLARNTPPHSCC